MQGVLLIMGKKYEPKTIQQKHAHIYAHTLITLQACCKPASMRLCAMQGLI